MDIWSEYIAHKNDKGNLVYWVTMKEAKDSLIKGEVQNNSLTEVLSEVFDEYGNLIEEGDLRKRVQGLLKGED